VEIGKNTASLHGTSVDLSSVFIFPLVLVIGLVIGLWT